MLMRKMRITFTTIVAVAAGGLFTWAVIAHETGYAVASAMLTASAVYAGIRGSHFCPQAKLTTRKALHRDAVHVA